MKTLFTISLFLLCTLAKSQDSILVFAQVKAVDSFNKQQIFEKARLWAISKFEQAQGALQIDDRDAGLLAFDASTSALSPMAPNIDINNKKENWKLGEFYHSYTFKLKVQTKDGRYKVEITEVKVRKAGDYYLLTSNMKAPYKYSFSKQEKADAEWADVKITFAKFADDFFNTLYKDVSKKEDW